MRVRFRVFAGQSSDNLEDQVNNWLDDVEHTEEVDPKTHLIWKPLIRVKQIHTTVDGELIYLTLTYERMLVRAVGGPSTGADGSCLRCGGTWEHTPECPEAKEKLG